MKILIAVDCESDFAYQACEYILVDLDAVRDELLTRRNRIEGMGELFYGAVWFDYSVVPVEVTEEMREEEWFDEDDEIQVVPDGYELPQLDFRLDCGTVVVMPSGVLWKLCEKHTGVRYESREVPWERLGIPAAAKPEVPPRRVRLFVDGDEVAFQNEVKVIYDDIGDEIPELHITLRGDGVTVDHVGTAGDPTAVAASWVLEPRQLLESLSLDSSELEARSGAILGVILDGGVVQDVISNTPEAFAGVELIRIDLDVEGSDEDDGVIAIPDRDGTEREGFARLDEVQAPGFNVGTNVDLPKLLAQLRVEEE